ncbi:MAG: serine hydrolase domain-containing protein [Candidatus Aminicenantales bacterium]
MGFCRRALSASGRAIPLFAISALAFLAAGCETRQEALTKSRVRTVEHGLLRAIYLKGQRPEKLSLDARMEFYKVPGVGLAVMDRNGLEWAGGYGVRDAHSREPVTADTIFQAGELSQPVAAAAALELVDKGRLDLDGDVSARLRGSGLTGTDIAGKAGVTLRGILTRASGYNVLPKLLEEVTSSPFPSLMNDTVLGPLGMKNSAYTAPLPEAMKINAASGHGRDGRPVEGKWTDSPAAAASGLWTSPSELLSFAADILRTAMGKGGKILTAALARAMLTPQDGNRGLGFEIEGTGTDIRFRLQGRTRGFTCSLDVYPYKGQGAVVMTNSDNGFLVTEEVLRSVSAAYEWPDFKPQERPLFRLDPSIYRQYVGRYEISPDYILDVSTEDYYLVIRPTGQAPTRFFVESQTFFFSVDPYVRIQFLSNQKGDVTGLILWQQDFKQEAKKVG